MGRKRHTPEQIITALREAEVGLARDILSHEATFVSPGLSPGLAALNLSAKVRRLFFYTPFYGAGGQDAPSPRAVGSFFDRRRPHGLDCPVDDSGWGGVRSQGPHRSPEDVHSRRVLRSGAGTILLSGTLWPIASFGSPGVHSL